MRTMEGDEKLEDMPRTDHVALTYGWHIGSDCNHHDNHHRPLKTQAVVVGARLTSAAFPYALHIPAVGMDSRQPVVDNQC